MSTQQVAADRTKQKTPRVLRIDPKDNVVVALETLEEDRPVVVGHDEVRPLAAVAAKHKMALEDLAAGDPILMYGGMVGRATEPIAKGGLLTTRNVRHDASAYHEKTGEFAWTAPDASRWKGRTFDGYLRQDGQVGTRNYWIVVPLVFCENRNVGALREAFEDELGYGRPQRYRDQVRALASSYRKGPAQTVAEASSLPSAGAEPRSRIFPNVDGIRFLVHQMGCGGTRGDAQTLCGLLAGYIHHPNVAGATVLSLGCQNAQMAILREEIRKRDAQLAKPVLFYEQQRSGTESAMLSEAIAATFSGLAEANGISRQPAPIQKLTVGLKCGGSDGFSGISANPALGRVSDLLAAIGARSILSEFPELCGMEQNLINRCRDGEAGQRFAQLMHDFAARAKAVGSGFEMNPSPGNIRDGLITDAMKAAGAARKGGSSPVEAVLDYPEYATATGLNLLCTPGNDVECVTAQVGAGANIVLFTTGLGTPTGNPVAPVVKVSTNTVLARKMNDIIDFDAGPIVEGEAGIEETGDALLDFAIEVASGHALTKAEQLNQYDFIPWKRDISL